MAFSKLMEFETDCWNVHFSIENHKKDFILLDVRSHDCFQKGHIDSAVSVPYSKITIENLNSYPSDTLFVVYCAGPHCNATEKAAIRLAKLNRPVKKMIGGVTVWIDEGFSLTVKNKKCA